MAGPIDAARWRVEGSQQLRRVRQRVGRARPAVSVQGNGYGHYDSAQSDPMLASRVPVLLQDTVQDWFAFLGAAYYILGLQRESDAARERALALDPGVLRMVPPP